MSNEGIQGHGLFSAMELIFKHCREKEGTRLGQAATDDEKKLAIIYSEVDSDYAEDLVKYLVRIAGDQRPKEEGHQLLELCANALPAIGEKIMTFAQQFRQEGRQEERLEMAKSMLGEGADFQFVKRVTKLSDKELASLRLH